jgi:sarcosine oxidase delta subunit
VNHIPGCRQWLKLKRQSFNQCTKRSGATNGWV